MKKLLSLIIAAAMLMTSFVAVHGDENDIEVLLDGQAIEFDVPPQIVGDRTLVPFRAIFESLGYEVEWYEEVYIVTGMSKHRSIEMSIGSYTVAMVEHSPDTEAIFSHVELDVPPQIIGDRTMVPVRAVAELSGYDVQWDEDTYTVIITTTEDTPTKSDSSDSKADATPSPDGTSEPESSPAPGTTSKPKVTPAPGKSDEPETTPAPDETDKPEVTPAPDGTDKPEATPAPDEDESETSGTPTPGTSNKREEEYDDDTGRGSGEPLKYYIEYDDTNEKLSSMAKEFEIIDIDKNADGDYEIVYKVRTYRDDSGNLVVSFNCLDEDGHRISGFSDIFHTWAYSWTLQEGTATLPGNTVKIELALNE